MTYVNFCFTTRKVRIAMNDKKMQITNHDFLIYKNSNDDIKVSVMLINNDIWLTQNLIAELLELEEVQ